MRIRRPLDLGVFLSTAIAALLLPAAGRASPLIATTPSVGDNAGYQGVASGPGAASTYFNPALLMDANDDVLLGFALISEQMGITLDGRTGGDVPLAVGGRDIVDPNGNPIPNGTVPTQWLQQGCPGGTAKGDCPPPGFAARPRQMLGTSGKTRTYLTLGLVKSFIKDRFTVGLYGMLPLSSFTTAQAFYPDEREALFGNSLHPELYGDRLTSVSIVLGAAFKLLPSLSIGAAVSLGLANTASSQDYVQDATNYNSLLLDNTIGTQVNVSPTAGVRWNPVDWLRVGGAIHAPESFTVATSIDNELPSGTESGTTQTNVFDWMPWSVAVGVEAEVVRSSGYRMSVVGSLDYAFWSAYQDRHGQSPTVYGQDLAWRDTVSGALGVRHAYKDARAFMDLHYVPTPVPAQVGRSNYVDNDRFGLAVGGDVLLRLPTVLRPGFQVFVDRFVPRYQQKDSSRIVDELPDGSVYGDTHDPVAGSSGLQTNNPGWPGFSSGGWIWGGTVTISVPL
jgi:hypothetical protein